MSGRRLHQCFQRTFHRTRGTFEKNRIAGMQQRAHFTPASAGSSKKRMDSEGIPARAASSSISRAEPRIPIKMSIFFCAA